ncbi:MAG: B12-binding domain-containing protein [Armatimonadetes bacterium]|nr:B12-binding domain-containing protein [Armatimonadota bacterium]
MSEGLSERRCTYDPLIEFMARFENVKASDDTADPFAGLTVEESLKKHIIDGIKRHLERHLDEALESYEPLAIVNDILLDGMKTVGELFGSGKMQLPFVLQSAEVMKAAVRYLEPKMEKSEGSDKGSILLATVAGDVHDIGKNLVDIILSNNGYRVVNIGIKQPINSILDQASEHRCQVIGLSGLLVKSTLIMRDNLLEMNERGLQDYPVILGGAALTRAYVEQDLRALYKGQVHYAQDAFEGLRLMEEIGGRSEVRGPRSEGLATDDFRESEGEVAGPSSQVADGGSERGGPGTTSLLPSPPPGQEEGEPVLPRVSSHRLGDTDPALYVFDGVRSETSAENLVPELPFYGARKMARFDIFELYKYINTTALFRGQWNLKRPEGMGNPEFNAWLEETARPVFERLQRELARVFRPQVKWGYFWCQSEGNDLILYHEDRKTERTRFRFPRQRDGRRLCLSDFFRSKDSGVMDVAAFHLVTVGPDISIHERKLFKDGAFQDYAYVHGMGVEAAEALAEYWHRQIRAELGFGSEEPADMKGLYGVKYRGCRYSFGYPACPNLEDQAKVMNLLEPSDIGVTLSEEFMLEPEQSTSAIIVHHPDAKYFNVR